MPLLYSSFTLRSSLFEQIIDTGLDETSCYFIDDDGLEVEHGYYYEGLGAGILTSGSSFTSSGSDFDYFPERRKVRRT